VQVQGGRETSSWMEKQLPCGTLVSEFPALFSHRMCPNASVAHGFSLHARLTQSAERELQKAHYLITGPSLTEEDCKFMVRGEDKKFSTRVVFMMLSPNGVIDPPCQRSLGTNLPSNIKIFSLLAFNHCLNT
jgi:hypothetical protein